MVAASAPAKAAPTKPAAMAERSITDRRSAMAFLLAILHSP
jgi:hypothetical protein